MKKEITYCLTFLLLLINHNVILRAQDDVTKVIKERFQKYIAAVPWEEIYIHTDRNEYISGEELWFNIYLIDGQSYKPSELSRIVYFELFNTVNRPIIRKRFFINKGYGPGQIHLPDTLSSGTYTIKAYTNWMKNFLPFNCFIKDLKIYNAINNKEFTGLQHTIPKVENVTDNVSGTDIERQGISMKINDRNDNFLELSVSADEKFCKENNNLFYLFIQTRGNIDRVSPEILTGNKAKILVPFETLTSGINQITVFDTKARPVFEIYSFTPDKDNPKVTISSAEVYSTRENIRLDIDTGDSLSGDWNHANLSISVAPAAISDDFISLKEYLIFGTEFGFNSQALLRSDKFKEASSGPADSILLKLKSNWINWESILSGNAPHLEYQAEKEDHFLSGKLLPADKPVSLSSELVLLCMPGKAPWFQYARTDKEGNFTFNIHIDDGLKDFVFMPDKLRNGDKLIIESPFSATFERPGLYNTRISNNAPPSGEEWGTYYQIRKIYGISDSGSISDPVARPLKPLRFYGKPDIELIMSDYITLPEMKEVFLELLPHVSLRKKNPGYEIMIANRINDTRNELFPALFLDGVKISDPSIIVDLDPGIVEKIDVVMDDYRVGKYSFPGLLNVTTRSADFSSVSLPDYMTRVIYRVVEAERSFTSPDYSLPGNKESTLPDFRNTLYWNPSVRPDRNGKTVMEFWSSDVVTDYVINLQGITQDGKIISLRRSFKLK